MRTDTRNDLVIALRKLRRRVEPHFQADTAAAGFPGLTRSAGHCAAVATIAHTQLGGQLVSAMVSGVSHWFNRFATIDGEIDIDLTADQFGLRAIEMAASGHLYPGTRVRTFDELHPETLQRAARLAARAQVENVVRTLREILSNRAQRLAAR